MRRPGLHRRLRTNELVFERGCNVQPSRNPCRRVSRDGHAHARHRRREHGAAEDRVRPRRRHRRDPVGRRRVHARARGDRAHRRIDRRPLRAAPAVHHRPRRLHSGVALVRSRDQHRDARHGPGRAGPRRGRPLRHVARPARRRVPGVEGPLQGARDLRRHDRRLLRRRPGDRRGDDLVRRLALGLLRERPGGDRHDRRHLPLGARVARPERPPRRLARPDGGRPAACSCSSSGSCAGTRRAGAAR